MSQYKIVRAAPARFIVYNTADPTFEVDGKVYYYRNGGRPVSRHRTKQSAEDLISELERTSEL